jgi:D-serine deaminase-like pyridoxal phosphate-dependent protein
MASGEWYTISNVNEIDTPFLAVYPDRIRENIRILKTLVPDVSRLRPHAKTHKSSEVAGMLMEAGITKFKCATIAEAEMLAAAGAPDVLLAYQPLGPKARRLAELAVRFPMCRLSALVDSEPAATFLGQTAIDHGITIPVYIDLNIGMDRTGIAPEKAMDLFECCRSLAGLQFAGLHAYDGHLRESDLTLRAEQCNKGFAAVTDLAAIIARLTGSSPTVIAGGTPSFPVHAKRPNVECSPGTFIFWDKGYGDMLPEQPFLCAALTVTRIISIPSPGLLCTDLGHKSIASENPIDRRVHFLNAPALQALRHSEEHLVLKSDGGNWKAGDVLYGVPFHICPTTALYDTLNAVEGGRVTATWKNRARDRRISV